MRLNILRGLILTAGFITACAERKIVYDFPVAMSENVRQQNYESCEKGRILFDVNCGGCHYKEVKGRKVIPDFSMEQLSNYEFRFLNRNHEDSLTESRLSQDELVHIITFLTYKKKSGIGIK
ncbi:MAG TPA: hypothetical protein VGF79_15660 [Bacteroidia bacterium]